MVDVAAAAGIPVETLRKIETGRIATPAFFTIAALGSVLGLDLASLATDVAAAEVESAVDAATA